MAIEPRRTQVTREHVQKMIDGYKTRTTDFKATTSLEDYIRGKVAAFALKDPDVITSGHEDRPDTTPLIDMILADLDSYAH